MIAPVARATVGVIATAVGGDDYDAVSLTYADRVYLRALEVRLDFYPEIRIIRNDTREP